MTSIVAFQNYGGCSSSIIGNLFIENIYPVNLQDKGASRRCSKKSSHLNIVDDPCGPEPHSCFLTALVFIMKITAQTWANGFQRGSSGRVQNKGVVRNTAYSPPLTLARTKSQLKPAYMVRVQNAMDTHGPSGFLGEGTERGKWM